MGISLQGFGAPGSNGAKINGLRALPPAAIEFHYPIITPLTTLAFPQQAITNELPSGVYNYNINGTTFSTYTRINTTNNIFGTNTSWALVGRVNSVNWDGSLIQLNDGLDITTTSLGIISDTLWQALRVVLSDTVIFEFVDSNQTPISPILSYAYLNSINTPTSCGNNITQTLLPYQYSTSYLLWGWEEDTDCTLSGSDYSALGVYMSGGAYVWGHASIDSVGTWNGSARVLNNSGSQNFVSGSTYINIWAR